MTDSNTTATEAPASGDTAPSKSERGSEFAMPTGVKDAEIWDKHFGKAAEKDKAKPGAKRASSSESSKPGSKPSGDSSRPAASKASSKTSSDGTSDRERSSKPPAPDAAAKPSTPKASPSKSAETDSSKAEPKAEEPDEATDPEAPIKKARDLLAEAKKAEDPKEARRLYKRAMKEAFGEVPEEFDDSRYAAIRRERKTAHAELDAKAQKNEARIHEAAEKLKPAIYVMRQLEGAGVADKLTVPLVERAITVVRALKDLENGDYTKLAECISKATGVDPDEAMKRFVRGVKISPEGRAARAAAEQAQQRAAAAEQRMAELERRLAERDTAQTEAQKRAEHERRVTETRAAYVESIESELEGHPVLKLKNGSQRVMRYIIRTADKTLKAPRFSFAQAADRIVRAERARAAQAAAAFGEADDAAPEPAPAPARRGVAHIPRSARTEAGTADASPEASFARIWDKHRGAGGRR